MKRTATVAFAGAALLLLPGCGLATTQTMGLGSIMGGSEIPPNANITICSGDNACPRMEAATTKASAEVVVPQGAPTDDSKKVACIRDLPIPNKEIEWCREGNNPACMQALDRILAGTDGCVGTIEDIEEGGSPWWKVWDKE